MNPNRLLVVDDERDLCEFVEAVALDQDFEVVTCCHGEVFMREYADFAPSAIIMDIVMPDVDGIELVRFLAAVECECPVLVTSGFPSYLPMIKSLGEGLGLSAINGQTKPLHIKDLRGFLADCMTGAEKVV